MSDDRQYELWFTDYDIGQAYTWTFEGLDGLARLSGPVEYVAAEPGDFRARLVRVQLDHVALEAFRATPHRAVLPDPEKADRVDAMLTFVLLAEGRMRLESEAGAFDLEPGQVVVIDSRRPSTYSADVDVRMLRAMVGIEHVPAALRRRGAGIAEPLPRSPLIDAFVAFLSSVLRSAVADRPVGGVQITRAVADLVTAVLSEAQDAIIRTSGDQGLRDRIEEYIETHLGEAELGPSTIARAHGVSLRHVHGTFNRGDRTITRFIRDRRIEAISALLRESRELPSDEYLAARFGFTGADVLQRAFRRSQGVSTAKFHERSRRERP